jgi:hypothetical protein
VEPHGFTAVAPLHTLRRAEPSEAYPPSPRLRRIPSFIPAFTGGAFSASRRRVKILAGEPLLALPKRRNYVVVNDVEASRLVNGEVEDRGSGGIVDQ